MNRRGALAVMATVVLAACATVRNPVSGEVERTVMDERSELRAGQQAHQEVLKEYRALANPVVQAYVDGIGQKLARASHRANLEWHFTVLDSPEVNAFALPGGYVYITRGILAYLDSEAELAGVLGHEIGHVTARHASQRATRQQAAGVGVLLANVLGAVLESKGVSGAADFSSQAAQLAAAGYIAAYSREQESQADRLGADYLARNTMPRRGWSTSSGRSSSRSSLPPTRRGRKDARRQRGATGWLPIPAMTSVCMISSRSRDRRQTALPRRKRMGASAI